MEEASVAGESPDRSKQRESSTETTSGSAGPVPAERDPRLAVAREAEPPERGGTSDTATRVLSVRADAAAPGPEGEGRLREAVAAWVRTAEPDTEAPRDTEAADIVAEDASGAGTDTTADGADDAAASGTDTDTDPTHGDTPDAREEANAADGAEDAEDTTSAGADATTGSTDTDTDPTHGDTPDAREEANAADGAEDAEDTSNAGADATTGSTDTDTDPTHGDTPDAREEANAADGAADGAEGAKNATGAATDAAADDADDTAASGTDTDADPTRGGTSDAGADTSDGADDDAGAQPASASEERTGDEDGGADTAAEGTGTTRADASDADDTADGDATPDDGGAGAAATGKSPESGDAGAGKGPGVDQPTAVFRTRQRSVDQPTTMLKLGDQGATAAEAERTSKFVALKGLDDPAARKPSGTVPPPAAEATGVLPQVGPERTTQQPLPPKPPLDLLAELTNTPPPPQTPLRTALRRVKIWTPLVLLVLIIFAVAQNFRPLPEPGLELTAQDSFTFEGGKPEIPWPADGQAALDVQGIGTFGSSGEQKPVPIASVAKVMTAYLILRDHPLKSGAEGPMIKIDDLAEKQSDAGQESTVDVTAGDEISQREAIEAILIASANNVARLLARWDAGSEKEFVAKMNEAAKDLGMTNTTYTDPSGLNDTTVSTAVDQVKLAREAMKQPAFREVAAMMSYDDYKGTNHSNWNQLVGRNNVVGIKTGTTTSALGNLVFAAKKDVDGETRTIVGAVVRQPAGGTDNTILSAALTAGDQLIRAAQDALEAATLLKKGDVVGYVDDGLGGRTPVVATEDVKAVGWAGLKVKLTFAQDEVPHQAKAGTKVGTLTVGDGTSSAVKIPVALQEDLVEPGFTDKLTRIT
ncbi:D-alanyl-D-alanine carboxypeptidase [Streptomyces sp. WAC 01420]|uniref:D-alanyl-D-alanine carboxypeptidase n=1 Tax=Streptomyces sp. WAC 01420 TaxID=2203203 RepID=UPI000F86FA15|nr:D-alanyl-D-alanine carboxypeptidase [Streptomyces sp. WAC 01420]RSN02138.1 D-alanyl-D-alanine carboxypeptidase [Streptomyces sp. WAC 01420]